MIIETAVNAIVIGFVVTMAALFPLVSWANVFGIMDLPTDRKQHGHPVPLVGGLAIFVSLISISIYLNAFGWLLFCAGVLLLVGVFDDKFHLGVRLRLLTQLGATVLMGLGSGVWIDSFGTFWGLQIDLGYAAVPFTIFAVVGLTNAFNMLDGIDGLASGHGIITIVSLLVASLLITEPFQVSWILGLLAAIAAFWLINMQIVTWLPRVFLGDSGSTVLGFVFAWLLIGYSQKPWGVMEPVMVLWCISIPAIDTVSVIIRRLKQKRSPFSPDRTHLHHLFLDAGVSARKTLWLLLCLTLAINVVGLMVTKILGVEAGLTLFCLLLVLLTYVVVSSKRLLQILGMMSTK